MELFMGYLQSSGKAPLSSVKNKDNWLSEPPIDGDYCGVLRHDVVQLDFDTEHDSKIALQIVEEYRIKCDILKTSRGIHIYLLDDGNIKSQAVGIFNAVGLQMDVGLGSKNRVVPLKTTREVETIRIINGEETTIKTLQTTQREWLQTYDELDILPSFFRPISMKDYNLKDTNTRNQTLFTYIMVLQTHNFTKDEVRKIIRVINKHIIYEPLSDREIDIITRDDAFSEQLFFGEKGGFLHDRFGNYMLTNSNILNIDGQLCIYTNNHLYSNNPEDFERVMLSKIPSLKDTQRKEVYKYVALKCTQKGDYANPKYIGLKNAVVDIETMEEIPYSPSIIMNNKIDVEYNPDAYSEIMDKTLDKVCCNDVEVRALLEEMIGYTLYRANTMQSCFILTGEGSNGKSTILNVIKKLIGKQNYTSLDMKDLEDTFKPAELYGKLANIGDDISAKYMEGSSVFKKAVTGESILTARKYGQPFELESYATQIFSANQLPQVNDKSDGFSRRIIIVPFTARFSKDDADYDPFIEDKLMNDESLSYLLKLAIEGLRRVIIDRGFTKSDRGMKEKAEYVVSNNNVLEWFEDSPKIENEAVNDVYLSYQVWASMNGCQSVKKINLSREIKKHLGLVSKPKSVDGKTCRVYVREDGS